MLDVAVIPSGSSHSARVSPGGCESKRVVEVRVVGAIISSVRRWVEVVVVVWLHSFRVLQSGWVEFKKRLVVIATLSLLVGEGVGWVVVSCPMAWSRGQ
jgi:hypothetical protein